MIQSFADGATEDIFDGVSSRRARRACPSTVWPKARDKLEQLDSAQSLNQLRLPPGNKLEQLKGDCTGQYSIRINTQYRICFRWESSHAYEVKITDYHR